MGVDDWTGLFLETCGTLRAYAQRRAAPEDADDAVAETYLRALASIEAYRPDRPVVCWLIGILRNVLREQARRDGRWQAAAPVEAAMDPAEHVVRSEQLDTVRVALDRLTPDDRRIVVLRVVEGWSSEQAGAATGRAPASVRMAQTRAMRRLRLYCEEAG